jgi:P27 family predicted phage terminase small subunit
MRGDKPMPTELKVLRMTAKKAEKLVRKITPTPGPLIEPPEWLTSEQKEEWRYAIENAPRNVLKKIDKAVLAGFIIAQDTHRKASVAMAQTELLVKSPTQGLPLQNPYLPIVNRQMVMMTRVASELGFTPCSRARIDAGGAHAPVASDWDDVATG